MSPTAVVVHSSPGFKESSELVYDISAIEYIRRKFDYIDAASSDKDGINLEDEREYYGHDIIIP